VLYKITCTHKLALRAIRFKYHDQLQQCSIGFQSATPETMQNYECFCTYQCLVALGPITGSTRSTKGVDTRTHRRPMCQRISKSKGLPTNVYLCFYYFQHIHRRVQKARGSRSIYLFVYIIFSMGIVMYKKQGAPEQHTSLLLLLSACASPCTKNKGLTINVPFCFYYFQHTHRHV
jgi:hypothetical protein